MIADNVEVVIPDITDYEVRRELVRVSSSTKLVRLAALREELLTVPVNSEGWAKAAEFWALARKAGRPTADRHALDGDAILAEVAATIGSPGDEVAIATTNGGHLARFPGGDARWWGSIT